MGDIDQTFFRVMTTFSQRNNHPLRTISVMSSHCAFFAHG